MSKYEREIDEAGDERLKTESIEVCTEPDDDPGWRKQYEAACLTIAANASTIAASAAATT